MKDYMENLVSAVAHGYAKGVSTAHQTNLYLAALNGFRDGYFKRGTPTGDITYAEAWRNGELYRLNLPPVEATK